MQVLHCSPADHSSLNVQDDWELRFWCAHLGVRPCVLIQAVQAVGCHLADVVEHLKPPQA
jgi:hypothetical protein